MPDSFITIPAVALKQSSTELLKINTIKSLSSDMDIAMGQGKLWLETGLNLHDKEVAT